MKKRIVAGVLAPLLLLLGVAFMSGSPVSAANTGGQEQCFYGWFCYTVTDTQGSRGVALRITPNSDLVCVSAVKWANGIPIPISNGDRRLPALTETRIFFYSYTVYLDATVNLINCQTYAKILSLKVAALDGGNAFI